MDKTTEGRQYIARTKRMSNEEKKRFFFQEYIRMGHASRIAELITGRVSTKWGPEVKTIVDSINKMLEDLPTRFRIMSQRQLKVGGGLEHYTNLLSFFKQHS